jgi:hypothetical protein
MAGALHAIAGGALLAQQLPTSQPRLLQIYREQIKTGHEAAHVITERAWPEAYARANSPDYYLALASVTARPEVWFLSPWESYAAWGASMARNQSNLALTAEIDQVMAADAAHVEAYDILEAAARPDLSHGAFPDLNKMRFWEISVWRIRPGHDRQFVEAATAYKQLVSRTAPNARWRMYQVTAGMVGPTYISFSSVESFGQFDAMMAEGESAMNGMTPDEGALFERFFRESVISMVSNKYRLNAAMSYVSPETKATDPTFWK